MLTADDLARLLQLARKTIYALAASGEIPGAIRIGRHLRFRSDSVLQWLGQNRAPLKDMER